MSDLEQQLIEKTRRGELFAAPDRVVRAELIRELLLGRHGELDPRGVRLEGVRIQGALDLDSVHAVVGLELSNCVIDEPIQARRAVLPLLMLYGGRCAGLHADGVHVNRHVFLRGGIQIDSDRADGAVRLLGADIAGYLDLSDAEITSTAGPALHADHIRIGGYLIMRDRTRITGHSEFGAVNLLGAHIAASVELRDVEITNAAGPALSATRIHIGGTLRHDRTRIAGHGEHGAINLLGARIAGNVVFSDVEVTNLTGAAVRAGQIRIDHSLLLRKRIRLAGDAEGGAVDLVGAHVDSLAGQEEIDLEVRAGSAPLLDLSDMTVAASVALPTAFVCPDRGRGPTCAHKRSVRLDEFSFRSLGRGWDWDQWLHVIRCHTPAYHASAYQRLAAVERAAGHDGIVRQILIAQQTDLRRRNPEALGGRLTRGFHWLWGVLAGYGYRARRTALALLLVLAAAGSLGWWAGQVSTRPGHLAAERVTSSAAAAGTPCSTVELVGLGLDRGLPLGMIGMRTRCDLDTSSREGGAFTWAIWFVQVLVWGLATLALAGYTNLVRKPG